MDKGDAKAPCPCIKMWEDAAIEIDKLIEKLAAKRGKVYDPSKSLVTRLAARKQEDSLREAAGKQEDSLREAAGKDLDTILANSSIVDGEAILNLSQRVTKVSALVPLQKDFLGDKEVAEHKSIVSPRDALTPCGRIVGGKRKALDEISSPQKCRTD